jgi:hypothetical protein
VYELLGFSMFTPVKTKIWMPQDAWLMGMAETLGSGFRFSMF